MKVYDAAAIRNVAVVGHGGCGKTQLVSAMLFAAGAVNRLGKVDEGTTVTDFDEEEIARKHTLSSSLAHAEWQKTKINIIDAPGFANFLSDAKAALRAFRDAQRRLGVAQEVREARRVDDVDLGLLPLGMSEAGGERVLAGDFFFVEVGHGGAFVHLAEPVDRAGGEEHRGDKLCLAASTMADHRDVPDGGGVVDLHKGYPPAREVKLERSWFVSTGGIIDQRG